MLPTLRVVFQHLPSDGGPDAENQALEAALEAAIERLASPQRDAALQLFGFAEPSSRTKGLTLRSDYAARALYMDGRSFRRKPRDSDAPESPRGQLIEAVAKSLCRLEANAARAGVGQRPLLLYVEDKQAFISIARAALPDYEVVSATTLGEAMDALVHGGPFALVLVDPNLTDEDDRAGLEVLEYLRDHLPDTPRIVVTGSRFPGAITTNLGARYGVSDILIKGDYTLPDLRSTIDRAVRRWNRDATTAQANREMS